MNNRKIIINHEWLRVIREDVRFPHGVTVKDFFIVERPSYAAVVPLLDQQTLLLVRQYRHGPRASILNLPMGVVSANEQPHEAAQRELQEETGYVAQTLVPMGIFDNSPSFLRLKCYLFMGTQLKQEASKSFDDLEETKIVNMTLSEAKNMIRNGEITDMTTVIGIHFALLYNLSIE
jgi:8-oxo-dGTP pyrophosphatase MutT (NUDIX family)